MGSTDGEDPPPGQLPDVSDPTLSRLGFDTTSPGLETISDPAVRTRILRAFRDEYRTTAERVRYSTMEGDFSDARDLLHRLMGTTATIGLPALRQAVIELQRSIHERPELVTEETLGRFTDEIDRVVTALDYLGESDRKL